MYFDSWSGFLAMAGHGIYVWSAYAVASVVIAYNLAVPLMARRRIFAQIAAQVRREERLVKRGVDVNQVTAGSGDDTGRHSANSGSTQQKHCAERQAEQQAEQQKENLESVKGSAQ